ncbi:SCO family protein [Parahaliea maris]|uniref:SCO family protein n=1 Tax=Parahaliea maris TaxID=2716870 RepID=A0A5C9A2S1_9GAMM|nr:SCO family protein [Parahaliea maris]TXS94070.1 SCO family protein [Parahaliea maris]
MSLSPKARMLVGILAANAALLCAAAWAIYQRPPAPPHIQGVYLDNSRALPDFTVLDQHGQPFGNRDLLGAWHLLSYGFTTCPDICPTTLNQLVSFTEALTGAEDTAAPRILFYSIDYRRDTPQQLAAYLPYFDKDFIGLTHEDDPDNPHLGLEQGLGLLAQLEPLSDSEDAIASNDYRVSHGVALYLLNPAGELQAVFKPVQTGAGLPGFAPETLVRDYRAVRQYVAAGN